MPAEIARAVNYYRQQRDWRVEIRDSAVVLPLTAGLAAVSAPVVGRRAAADARGGAAGRYRDGCRA
ncbi:MULTISPECIES: hypothetical protein [Amycolatopsis]|uniref:Uncharacterized protein n=1 Tax=Amycolatopsis albidoflavus TaxID=102226 RepID=A0ABW5HRT6_9PSEU